MSVYMDISFSDVDFIFKVKAHLDVKNEFEKESFGSFLETV